MNRISTQAAGSPALDTARAFRWLWAAAFALFAAANPIAGNAGAMFIATATAKLEIVSISVTGGDPADFTISGLACPPCTFGGGFADGNAVFASDGFAVVIGADPDNLVVDTSNPEGLNLSAEASGSASPDGEAIAGFEAFASIDMANVSPTGTFTIGFRLIWSLSANAGADNPGPDDALTGADILVASAIDVLLDEFVASDALFGPFGPQSLSDTLLFSITLLPGESDFIDIDIAAGGFATSVPEPGSWALLAFGLALLLAQRRRQRISTTR